MNNVIRNTLLSLGLIGASACTLAAGNIENGKAIVQGECAACHNADGNSASPMFPKLAGLGEKYIAKQLTDIRNGATNANPKKASRVVPEMAPFITNKTDQDIADLAAYFNSQTMQLTGAKKIEIQLSSGEKVDGIELGARLFRSGNREKNIPACTGCHSPKGGGNAPAAFPRLSGQFPEYIEKQLKAFRAGERQNDPEKVMRDVATNMSDGEIKALANYISGLN